MPRQCLDMDYLGSILEEPQTKFRRLADGDGATASHDEGGQHDSLDIDGEANSTGQVLVAAGTVWIKVSLVNPKDKKTVAIAPGAGGKIKK